MKIVESVYWSKGVDESGVELDYYDSECFVVT